MPAREQQRAAIAPEICQLHDPEVELWRPVHVSRSLAATIVAIICATFLLVAVTGCKKPGSPSAAQLPALISHGSFPPGDLLVSSDGGTSGQLMLQFENLDPQRSSGKSETQMYMIAGVPGKLPAAEVVRAHYSRYLRGRVIEDMNDVPASIDPVSGRGAVVRFSEIGQIRHLHVYTLTVVTSVLSPEPGWQQDSSWVLRNLQVRLDLGSPVASSGFNVSQACAKSEAEFLHDQILNANIGPEYWVKPAGLDFTKELAWSKRAAPASASGSLFRFGVYAPGFYRISSQDIIAANGTSGTLSGQSESRPVSQWRVFRNGDEIPAYAAESFEGLILPVSRDEFATPNEAVYWLFTQSTEKESSAPLRLTADYKAAPAEPEVAPERETTITLETVSEQLEDYHARLRPGPTTTRWYWKAILHKATGLFQATLPANYNASGATSVEVCFGLANYATTFPAIRFFANGQDCGITSMSTQQGIVAFTIPEGRMRPGENICGLRLEYPGESAGQEVLIQSLKFRWNQVLRSGIPKESFQWQVTSASQQLMLPIAEGRASSAPLLAAYTPGSVTLVRGGLSPYKSVLAYQSVATASDYAFLDENSTTEVRNLRRVSDFKEPVSSDVDYVAVTAPELAESLKPLLDAHIRDGRRVELRTAQTLFDQFTYGKRDGEAIRKFVRYLFLNARELKPMYLLLAGECSDYRGDPKLLPAGSQQDLVPTIGGYVGEGMHGDHGYSQIAGDDMLADIAVGRLSVASATELKAMVAKFESYRTKELGDWIYRAQFLFDDNEEFPRVVSQVVGRSMAPPAEIGLLRQSDYTYVPNLRVPNRRRSHEATAAVLEEFNYGAAIQNFFGHGGPNLWSHERLFHLMDLPQLHNENRLPLVTCLSCDNAWMDYPTRPVNSSMGELLVRKSNGGAIGLFGPVAGASPYEHQTLVSRLMEGVYRQEERRLGALTMYAKNMYYNETRSAALPEQYVLLGDPALALRIPKAEPGLSISPKSLVVQSTTPLQLKPPRNAGSAVVIARSLSMEDYLGSSTVTDKQPAEMAVVAEQPGAVAVQWNSRGSQPLRSVAGRLYAESASETFDSVRISKSSQPQFADIEVTATQPLTPNGDPNTNEIPVLRFIVRNAGKTASTTTIAILRTTTETLSDPVTIKGLTNGSIQPISFMLKRQLGVGEHSLELDLTRGSGAEVTTDSRKLSLRVAPSTDLEFVPGTARARSTTGFVQRSTVFLEAVLRNNGSAPAKSITLNALLENPETGPEAQTINDSNSMTIEELLPGEQRLVTYRWENTIEAGEKHLFLVVNRGRSQQEPRFDNNSIAIPAFTMKPLGNFVVRSLQTIPTLAAAGDTVSIAATVWEDSGTTRGPVDLEIGLRNLQTGDTTYTRVSLQSVAETTVVTKLMEMNSRYNAPYAAINPARELEELNPEDNLVAGETMLALRLSKLASRGAGDHTFREHFTSCRIWNMDPVSTDVLEISDVFTSGTGMVPIDPKWFVSGRIRTPATQFSQADDNLWSFDLFKLEASRTEDAGIVSFRFPAAEPGSRWPFAIYGSVAGSPSFSGGPIGAFDARFGNDREWHHFDFTQRSSPSNLHRVLLTTSSLENGWIDVSIRHTTASAVIIAGLEAVPQVGGIESPAILLDGGESPNGYNLRSTVSGVDPQHVWHQTRTGVYKDGQVSWKPWSIYNGASSPVLGADNSLQWRVFVQPVAGSTPRLTDVTLVQQ